MQDKHTYLGHEFAIVLTPVIWGVDTPTPSARTVSTRRLPALARVLAVGVTHLRLSVRDPWILPQRNVRLAPQELTLSMPANGTRKVDSLL